MKKIWMYRNYILWPLAIAVILFLGMMYLIEGSLDLPFVYAIF